MELPVPISEDWVTKLAAYLGASGPALRLLLSVLLAYPMAFFHRQFLYKKAPILQHLYFTAAGSFLGFFNFGASLTHAYICIIVQYVVILISKASLFSAVFSFVFQMVYLLGLYVITETAVYDIKWTIPHCVLTLRLIGQAFDIFDGTKDPDDLSKEQKEQALKSIPGFFEMSGHVFYPGSFMIGPQFPMRRYLNFVEGKFTTASNLPNSVGPGIRRLFLGLLYVGIYQVGSQIVNNEYIQSPSYLGLPLWQKLFVVGVYGKLLLYKYVSCWIVSEGSCILGGISYNGEDSRGEVSWNGCENINIAVFEKAYKFSHIIASFNKCTNQWIAQYVYKRLKFVGNRFVSQAAALLFLAVWHGLHSGYYICFFMEFIVMNLEKDLGVILAKNPKVQKWHMSPVGFWIDVVILKVLVTIFFGYCTLPFGLLKLRKWWNAYKDIYFIGCLIFGLWPAYAPLVKLAFLSPNRKEKRPVMEDSKEKESFNVSNANGMKVE